MGTILADEIEVARISRQQSMLPSRKALVLTDKRLHFFEKGLGSEKRKTMDLRSVDTVSLDRRLNWNAILIGFFIVAAALVLWALVGSQIMPWPIVLLLLGAIVFILSRESSVEIRSASDRMPPFVVRGSGINAARSLVSAAMEQKARLHGNSASVTEAPRHLPPSTATRGETPTRTRTSGTASLRLAELKSLKDEGLITDAEFESKKHEILADV